MNDTHKLSYTTWNRKYHVAFAPKYRWKVFYGNKRLEKGEILMADTLKALYRKLIEQPYRRKRKTPG